MDKYLELFWMADESDSDISEQIKGIGTEQLKELDNKLKKEFKENNFVFDVISNEDGLISIQIAAQYFRLISLIGLELLEREK